MSNSLRIYNVKSLKGTTAENALLVDRRTPWGNPFVMKSEADRDAVCEKFEQYAEERNRVEPDWLVSLRGKNLICWCAPKRCHAETLIRLANRKLLHGNSKNRSR